MNVCMIKYSNGECFLDMGPAFEVLSVLFLIVFIVSLIYTIILFNEKSAFEKSYREKKLENQILRKRIRNLQKQAHESRVNLEKETVIINQETRAAAKSEAGEEIAQPVVIDELTWETQHQLLESGVIKEFIFTDEKTDLMDDTLTFLLNSGWEVVSPVNHEGQKGLLIRKK